ncbi:hypothetical protein OG897_26430 [Streptomyces sp. NBC_00237]|uniref:hypothetical protein n=1 Tax=Streptomyces sp. NBC_00237 TaxID=2975687 RepID=UPI0022567FAA|nr:hypothetical protein [Streptomyces sp. NBC_00237]MCX5204980.1 hypothetical protein [Streptomyces sp. NBC_00237]
MFLHVISPSRAFTKVPNALFRNKALNPAARLLLGYLGGLTGDERRKPLSAHAEEIGLKQSTFKRAKKELVQYGYVHDYRAQDADGRWYTDQRVSTVPLTEAEFTALRAGTASPGVPKPTVGEPSGPPVGRSTGTSQTNSKTSPTRPPKDTPVKAASAADANTPRTEAPDADTERHFALAERILRDLGTVRRDLALSVRNMRYLASGIAAKLQRGVPAWEIHSALTHGLPSEPILNAAGFITHRLTTKVPDAADLAAAETARRTAAAERTASAPTPRKALIECRGPGRPGAHVLRPVGDETYCDPCRREYPSLAALSEEEHGGAWAPLTAPDYPDPVF